MPSVKKYVLKCSKYLLQYILKCSKYLLPIISQYLLIFVVSTYQLLVNCGIQMVLDDSSQLTQVRSNIDPPGGVIKRLRLGECSEPYKEDGAAKCVKELSMRASQDEDKEKEDEKLDLVLGELIKIVNDSEDEIHYRTRYTLQ